MTQYIIDIGAYPDDGQGSPLRTAFDYTNENFNQIFAAGPVLSNIQIGNNTITTTVLNSNLILSPSGIGRVQFNNTLFPRLDDVYDIGTPSLRFNSIYLGTGGINATGGITTTGNISASYFIGNGSQLTGIVATTGSEVVNGNSNIAIPSPGSNIFVTVNGTGNVVTFANSGVYVAGEVSATGNISGNYILGNGALLTGINIGYGNSNVADYLPTYTGNLVSLTGPVTTTSTITGANLRTSGTISATGNIISGNVNTGRLNAGYITTGTTISAVGNISTSSFFIGDGSLLTNLPVGNYSNANVAAFLPTYTGNLVSLTGPVTTTANITGQNILTSGTISATGNITGGNVNTARLNASTVTVNNTISATGNITGNWLIGSTVSATTVTASGNVVGGSLLTSGQVSATGNIQGGNLNAPGGTVTSNTVSATGQIQGGNFVTLGTISATGNITGGNVNTARLDASNVTVNGPVSASGNVSGNNFIGNGLTVTGNVAAGNISTSGKFGAASLSATGNITGGNILTTGLVSATGNISGNYFVGNGSLLTGITVSAGTSLLNGNSNVVVAANGNITISSAGVSNVATFTNTGAYVNGTISATGNVYGNYFVGNVAANTINASDTIVGGNILTVGFVSATGNITADNYYYANGQPVPPGITYTAATAPPTNPAPRITDQWYDTDNDVLYEFISDGTSTYWVDTTSPAFAGGVIANVAISGTLVPVANVTYDIGTSTVYFRNTYTQNLYTNNRLPASNMPVGAVVQSVMSSSLGGSITNSTSYADVSYATVTITPSSATSKVLILATGTSSFTSLTGQDVRADTQLVRSPSTSLQIQTCGTTVSGGGIGTTGAISYSYIDSPGTTSAVTYKLQQKVSNSSSTLTSTNIWLIAMEIAAS